MVRGRQRRYVRFDAPAYRSVQVVRVQQRAQHYRGRVHGRQQRGHQRALQAEDAPAGHFIRTRHRQEALALHNTVPGLQQAVAVLHRDRTLARLYLRAELSPGQPARAAISTSLKPLVLT